MAKILPPKPFIHRSEHPGDVLEQHNGVSNDFYFVDHYGVRIIDTGKKDGDRVLVASDVLDFKLYDNATNAIEYISTQDHAGTTNVNLTGNATSQTIAGNDGRNVLSSGGGEDILYGFGSRDVFAFDASVTGVSTIADFDSGGEADAIALKGSVFGGTDLGGLTQEEFDTHVVYNSATGFLGWDATGGSDGDTVQFAWVTPGSSVDRGDFGIY